MQEKAVKYQFTTEEPPNYYEYSFQQSLYHRKAYLKSQLEFPSCSFWILDKSNAQIQGEVHFYFQQSKAVSQRFAPFGSFNGDLLPSMVLVDFMHFIEEFLTGKGINQIQFNHPPLFYSDCHEWTRILSDFGYTENSQVNHHLVVDDVPLSEKIHKMEKRKLLKCQDFSFRIHPDSQLKGIYRFIETCRTERNQRLSLSFEYLNNVVSNLPKHFLLSTVCHGKVMAAAAITVKVTPEIWYQFYPAHSKEFDRVSPMVYLLSKLYLHAGKSEGRIIDLGTSEIENKPIAGLMEFKTRMGGLASVKSHFVKTL